ncbi:unnamed protein product [Pelagomonas calceolata]|uniref:RanBP2-type domain-containing protein n=1 Tax=Pelagomonas calceolata TaxID=35677 RepID=A0A8J2SN97_9STRA|nr:unnamed protein product [Pelagomonas calceolata]
MSASARADALAALEAACRRVPRRPTPSAAAVPTTALLILPEWLTPIMTGEKTVELRAISSLKRGVRIGFCGSGTGRCWGEATFLHCEGPLDDARLAALQDAHGVRAPEGAVDAGAAIRTALNWNKVYAWHLTAAAPYEKPLDYVHPSGAITWVDLPAAVAAATAPGVATDAWPCPQCTLLNAPAAAACSACDTSRPRATDAAAPEGYDVDSDSSGPPRPRAAAPVVGDRVLRLDDVEGVVRARGRPGWFMVDLDGYDSAIEFEASELRVLSPADASDDSDDDRNAPRAAGRFDEFAFREASAPPRSPRPEAVPESVGEMRSLISSAGLSSADCVEKSELRARSVLALERLAEAKRLRDARNE